MVSPGAEFFGGLDPYVSEKCDIVIGVGRWVDEGGLNEPV